jgi:hypothetical protein
MSALLQLRVGRSALFASLRFLRARPDCMDTAERGLGFVFGGWIWLTDPK